MVPTSPRWGPWAVGLLVVSAYLVPFTLLARVTAWYGSFLFWTLFALAAIAVIVRLTRTWTRED